MPTDKARIAYLLQVFKHPEQVNLLIQQILSDTDAGVYIHVDKKSIGTMSRGLLQDSRVKVLKTSLDVSWGDVNVLASSLLLLREVMNSGEAYDFVTFRSGQDLIVRPGFSEFLAKFRGKSFLRMGHVPREDSFSALLNLKWPEFTRRLYDSAHPFRVVRSLLIRLYGLGIKPTLNPDRLPDRFRLHHGSAWWCMSTAHVKFVLDYLDANPWYYKAFESALIPDEWFYQTLIMNSPIAGEIINNALVYLKWGENNENRNHPLVLTVKDIPRIEQGGVFFARKFDIDVDRDVINYFVKKMSAPSALRESAG